MVHRFARLTGSALAAVLAAGCTVSKQEPPPLAGPSEQALSLVVSATPDVLPQDGASQAVVTALARGTDGRPLANVSMRAEIRLDGIPVDFGQLSARTIATGADGRASVVYTAPMPPIDPVDEGTVVQIAMTPIGTNYDVTSWAVRAASIRLVPPGVILPPNQRPVADFTFAPSSPAIRQKITFDGSASNDPDGTIVAWNWRFSDGDTRSGRIVQIAFDQPGSYSATLTVTDNRGLQSQPTTKSFTVGGPSRPTATFVFSPDEPTAGQVVYFNAEASVAAPGRTIVSYSWDFGDGTRGSGVTTQHVFASPGTYRVTLTVTDDLGNTGSVTVSVEVS
ncbi:MAG TPA: PKD domain-containing protein [Vicinamibacterales bacterium]|nr:PKD domain-containing protein [Vicinamibacterales bacterium]